MWDGVIYVEPSRRPIIHEGLPANVIVMNAGPGHVDLGVWEERTSDRDRAPSFVMAVPPGATRSASGAMIGVAFATPGAGSDYKFAALAWRVVR